jgi:hypothetical protein
MSRRWPGSTRAAALSGCTVAGNGERWGVVIGAGGLLACSPVLSRGVQALAKCSSAYFGSRATQFNRNHNSLLSSGAAVIE